MNKIQNKIDCCEPDSKSSSQLLQVLEFLKIISDKNRMKILCLLSTKEKCVCEIWQELKLPQNLASHHLKALKDFDLIKSKNQGRYIYYFSNQKKIQYYTNLLHKFLLTNIHPR